MNAKFLLIPAAIIVSAPAQAKIYMSIEDAQQLMFPGAAFEANFVTLDQSQFNAIIDDSGVNVYSRKIKAWKASAGGWFVLDQVRGQDDWITYAIAIDDKGGVQRIEILECLENYDGIGRPGWRSQFYGKRHGAGFDNVATISGATLSSGQMKAGVKRILSTYALVLAPSAG